MNNTKYTETIIYEGNCSFCQIDYVKEAILNDTLTIKTKQEEDILYALGTNNGEVSFKAKFKLF